MAVHLYSPEHPSAALKLCLLASVSVRCRHLWWLKGCRGCWVSQGYLFRARTVSVSVLWPCACPSAELYLMMLMCVLGVQEQEWKMKEVWHMPVIG